MYITKAFSAQVGSAIYIMSSRNLINPLSSVVSRCFFSIRRLPRTLASFKSPSSRLLLTNFSAFGSSLFCPSPSSSSYSSAFHMEKQFEELRHQLDESGNLRERIRSVAMEMESANRLMHSSLLLVHQSLPVAEVLEKCKVQIDVLKELYKHLAEILHECPGQYYRYHGDWRSETQTAVSLLAFLHWLETGKLLVHTEAAEKLGLDAAEFGLDIEDYLIGLCFMSNELPRYVVNRVTIEDYDCPGKVMTFLTDLHASFRMLNLRNDFLRKKFDGMKYDLRRVEEVYYDVKIRGLASSAKDSAAE
ncbi:hypothetical protein ACLOJK_024648 [Asimina triloba]